MITIRRSGERGHFDYGWLETYHTFSFGDYIDPDHRGFRSLRVINEDYVRPSAGFPAHGHRDMEIITYVISGELQHADSMGNGTIIRAGEVQRMSAGTGVQHSEFNPSNEHAVHLLQIWIRPAQRGLSPSYEQRAFEPSEGFDTLRLIASPEGKEDSLVIHQDAELRAAILRPGRTVEHRLRPGHGAWVQLIRGHLLLNGFPLGPGDGTAIEDEPILTCGGIEESEFLLFDLA